MALHILIEALLFYKAIPQKKTAVQKLFAVDTAEFETAISELKARLKSGATRLIETDTELQLSTAPELSEFVESLRKDELKGDIGKAGAETLAIILYREPVQRAEIDRIRGVNSSFIIRNLLVKGLIEKHTSNNRGAAYRITPALLQHLGTDDKSKLPRFSEFMNAIDTFQTEKV